MSHLPPVLNPTEDDIQKMLACQVHIGTRTCEAAMQAYVWGRRADGVYIINLQKTWEKLVLAARIIAGVENPQDVVVISARAFGQRAVLKFAKYTKAQAIAGRYTPGTFTNQVTKKFIEPRLLIATDPRTDNQAIRESSYCNLPVVALCHTDSPVRYVDIAIPCNNKARTATGLIYWMLTREVLRLRNAISRKVPWDVMPDLYFYRDPDEQEKQEEEAAAAAAAAEQWGSQQASSSGAAPQAAIDFSAQPRSEWGSEVAAAPAAAPAPAPGSTWDSSMPQAMSSSWETAPK
jgi:small subunit ribosomal protein SAe